MSLTACTSLFFHPSKTLLRTPSTFQLDYKDVYIETRDRISLHGWWIQPPLPSNEKALGQVLFLHGNAENISTHIGSVLWLLQSGYQVFALDYRGYGLSTGTPAVPQVFEDIRSSAQWLSTQPSFGPSIIGIHHARNLYAAANDPKQLIETTGGHIEAVRHADVRDKLLLFMANTETSTSLNTDNE